MADHHRHLGALTYGHFGTGTYSQHSHGWNFLRQGDNGGLHGTGERQTPKSLFEVVAQSRPVQSPAAHRSQGTDPLINDSVETRAPHSILKRELRALLKAAPELLPASSLLHEYQLVSQKTNSSSASVASPAELLTFTSAARVVKGKARNDTTVPVVAFAAGEAGNILMFAAIVADSVSFPNSDEGPSIDTPSISTFPSGVWDDGTSPIRQIVSSTSSGYQHTLLATRFDPEIIIFQPLYHKLGFYSGDPAKQGFQLEPNPVCTLPFSRTGGHPQVDVAFHPEDPFQFAIVDTHGHWSVWNIFQKRGDRSRHEVKLHSHGRLHSWDQQYRPETGSPHHDGWHAIRWIKVDEHTYCLAVCDRRKFSVFGLHTALITSPDMALGPRRHGHWILDVRSLAGGKELIVLTSTHIISLSPRPSKGTKKAKSSLNFDVVPIWRHFRTVSDTKLQLCLLQTSADTFVFMYSTQNRLLTIFRIGWQDHNRCFSSLSDPVVMRLPTAPDIFRPGESVINGPIGLKIYNVESRGNTKSDDAQFFKMFVLRDDLAIDELLLKTNLDLSLELHPRSKSRLSLPREQSFKSSDLIGDEGWKDPVASNDMARGGTFSNNVGLRKFSLESQPIEARLAKARATWSMDWQDVYESAIITFRNTSGTGETRNDQSEQAIRFADNIDDIMKRVDTYVEDEDSTHLLIDLVRNQKCSMVGEIDENFSRFDALVTEMERHPQVITTLLWRLPTTETGLFRGIYNHLVSLFLAPLSGEFSSRVRITKERVIRQVAVGLAFASISIHRPITSALPPDKPEERINPSSPPLPTQSTSKSVPSSPLAAPTPTLPIASAYTRLSTYTTITPPAFITSTSPPAAFTRVLSHLPPATAPLPDPSTYSFLDTRAALEISRTHPQTPAQLRAEARLQKRKARQQEIFESSQRERQAPPTLLLSSQLQVPPSSQHQYAGTPSGPSRDRRLVIRDGHRTPSTNRRQPGFGIGGPASETRGEWVRNVLPPPGANATQTMAPSSQGASQVRSSQSYTDTEMAGDDGGGGGGGGSGSQIPPPESSQTQIQSSQQQQRLRQHLPGGAFSSEVARVRERVEARKPPNAGGRRRAGF